MKPPPFRHIDFSHLCNLHHLAEAINTQLIDQTLYFPEQYGKGIIHQRQVSQGLSLTSWNIYLNEPFEIIEVTSAAEKEHTVKLACIFTPSAFALQEPVYDDMLMKNSTHILFDPGNEDIKYVLQPKTDIRMLVLHIEKKWLNEQLGHSISQTDEHLHELINADKLPFRFYPVMPTDNKELTLLFEHFSKNSYDILYLKGTLLMLLSRFLGYILSVKKDEPSFTKMAHHDKMKIVEKMLIDSIGGRAPKLSSIASEVALSETSLKRYFKSVYGKGIYEYYLEKKMEYAFELLTKKRMPVKEVAYRTGYEKCSSFTRVFKKHYQELPYLFLKTASI